MFNRDLVKQYIEIVEKRPEEYFEDYKLMMERVNSSRAIYKGKPIPMTYQGMLYSEEDFKFFRDISDMVMKIGRKVTKKYLEDPSYRALFQHDKDLEELILMDPGYDMPVPICRYDIFLNSHEDFKFCEFNTDGASAMNEDNTLGKILMETEAMVALSKKYDLVNPELFYSLIDRFLDIYHEAGGEKERPNVAIVDDLSKGTTEEFKVFKESFEDRGMKCLIGDIREIKYLDNKAYLNDMKVDLVYRRIVMKDLMAIREEAKDFIMAYENKAFICLGSFRSHIMHSKLTFKILRLKESKEIFTDEENSFIEKHIPYTEEFSGQEALSLVSKNKDKYILKPMDGYASQGVYSGREHGAHEWEEILKKILDQGYIYQEYFDMDKIDFVEFDERGKLSISPFSAVIGLFIYGEEFSGLYTRIGNDALISGARDYYTTPNILCKRK